jgi:hypothetical protein
VQTEADHQQWLYEFFRGITEDFGTDMTPKDVFPAMTRAMVEWCDSIARLEKFIDLETAQTLARSISELSNCLRRTLPEE